MFATHFIDSKTESHAPTIVLAHGVGLDLTMWDDLATRLRDRYRVVQFDALGHGETPALPREAKLADFVEQVNALIDELHLGKVVLVGFSMGGVVAQSFALNHGEKLAGLVLMSTVYQRQAEEQLRVQDRLEKTINEGLEPIADIAIERWFPEEFQAQHADAVAAVYQRLCNNDLRGYVDAYRVFGTGDREIGDRLTEVDCPALVMTGSEDPGSTSAMADLMARDLPQGQVHILPGLRHMVTMQAPQEVAKLISRFVDNLSEE